MKRLPSPTADAISRPGNWPPESLDGLSRSLIFKLTHYQMVRDWATTTIGETLAKDGPEVRAALLRRAEDPDEIVRAEALHGLARRRDERAVPFLIAELSGGSQRIGLFMGAAMTHLGLDEQAEIDPDGLVAMLNAGRGVI